VFKIPCVILLYRVDRYFCGRTGGHLAPFLKNSELPPQKTDSKATKRACSESDRIDEESREVGDGLPLGLDERRVRVEDDVAHPVSEQRAGSQRPDEVDEADLVRVAAGTQNEDHVLREHLIERRLTVLRTQRSPSISHHAYHYPRRLIAAGVGRAFSRVCLFVRALKGKRLELSGPNLVHIITI